MSWNSKKIAAFLNKKIRKKPCDFEIIDEETVGLPFIHKGRSPTSPEEVDELISTQEKYHYSLIKKIKGLISKNKIHMIIDQDGYFSILICKWSYRDSISDIPTKLLVVNRN